MRLIGNLPKESLALQFSLFLKSRGIENSVEILTDSKAENIFYEIWVYNEDNLEITKKYLEEFEKNPKNPFFVPSGLLNEKEEDLEDDAEKPPILVVKKNISSPMTSFFLTVCVIVFLINLFQEVSLAKDKIFPIVTPVQYSLLFDTPELLIQLDKIVHKYNIDPTKKTDEIPLQAQEEIKNLDHFPTWKGVYEAVFLKAKNPSSKWDFSGNLFVKIRQGQLWRLISPSFLHKDFLHILFNMIWLMVLGKQLERHLSKGRYLLFVLIACVIPNTAQYLMSGPYFLGYSGVIMAMVGFIWSRQTIAPWEGYPLQKMVIGFLAVYVISMFFLQLFSFVTQVLGKNVFSANIANTAHIVGAMVGVFLGRLPFFAWRGRHDR